MHRCFRVRLLALGFFVAAVPILHLGAAECYVDPAGNDDNPGTDAKPFASLERARAQVRRFKQAAGPAEAHVVWVRGGDYPRAATFELTEADSGTAGAPVRWQAAPNQAPRLLGGRKLSGFRPVTDAAVLARLDPSARPHVLQLDLGAQGITNFGQMKSRGFSRPTTPAHCELFVDGKPLPLARWPNEGRTETIAGFPASRAQNDGHGGQIGPLEEGFHYSGDRPRRWQDTSDLWVHGYWSWDWANSYERVASLDLDQRLIKTTAPYGLYGFRQGQRFHFLNLLEELDQPGEWFLDRKAGLLYVWPPAESGSADLGQSHEVLLSLLDRPLLRLSGASHVVFRGFTFEAGRGNAVEIRGGASNLVESCTLRNLGNYGVMVSGGHGHAVAGCDIFHTGDGGVSLDGGDRQTLTPGGHVVEHCHFAGQGRWSKCYVPAVLLGGVGHRVAHNLIHDHPHCAILFNGNNHLLEYNEIHHIALETGDVGAIYTGRDWTYRGNRIRFNFIHHTGGVGMGSMGVYMDDCVSGTEVFGNVFYKVHWAMFIGGGRDHRVENNLFVDCDPAVRMDGRGLDKAPVWFNMVYDYMKHQLAGVPQELYRARYPALVDLDRYYASTNGVPPENNVVARNVCVGKWLEVGWHAKAEWLKLEDNYTGPDPGFVAPEKMDFRLRSDSPAFRTGFKAIPLEQIGPQRDGKPTPPPSKY
jgi:hypothetical protein